MTHKTLILTVNSAPEEYVGVKKMEFDSQGGSIGRSAQCYFHLEDHNKYLSGTHALITSYNGEFYLNDISTNGTFINGKRALKNQPSALQEGDAVSVGRYEFTVHFENQVQHINLADDIMPEMKSIDPVETLDVILPPKPEEMTEGTVEELFLPKDTKADSTEPLYHLQDEDDVSESLLKDEHPQPEVDLTQHHQQRQMLDDSDSIHSEMDIPSLIPENWNFGSDQPKPQAKPAAKPPVQQSAPAPEYVPEPVLPKQQAVAEPVTEPRSVGLPVTTGALTAVNQSAESAFLDGLGLSAQHRHLCDDNWYKQMGLCLRACLNVMNSELNQSLAFAGEHGKAQTHLLDSMMSLYQDSVLDPSELVEHIQEELEIHRARLNQAKAALFQQHLETLSPTVFDAENRGTWLKNQRTWHAYQAYFAKQQSTWQSEPEDALNDSLAAKYRELTQEQNA
ncbi:type VI secretion system-associated FHA domain protein [Photobacterium sp. 1_MG-2023]|uniref:type VI secretion system-associated FHA domain protein n=1 Tax=Photobacterium sp. 1_MG-2023 TaxID=3062646 RepID=UPI0026E152D9|nr:FHA domain-containing protein [Photobacterium sp. 1_MG-2023]MDO6708567.1 FHA domain-containing protein [Photobacterium sp. 1_MG-2023]